LAPPTPSQDRQAVHQLLKRVHAAWTAGRFDDLADCFAEDAVIVPPGFQRRVEGRQACVSSYSDFLAATVAAYREGEPSIDVWGDTAVATFRWDMAWAMKGQDYRDSGHDVIVCTRQADRWLEVWRTNVSGPNGR
jgi:uncharacterized protein (TIGR02246 family)